MEKKRIIIMCFIIFVFLICISGSYIYYSDKYTVTFETGTEDIILSQYIDKNKKISIPTEPEKEDYVFVEWQLNGSAFNFDESITDDVVLTAKWLKEEYVNITYKTNSNYKLESSKILKGSTITDLPISIKENYEFIGWYLNDKLYNNELINDDITLVAQYKNNKVNTTYKIGDRVTIIGNYASSCYNINAFYNSAIGWERQILNIIHDSEYPYVVGNEEGVTGYFKAESIIK